MLELLSRTKEIVFCSSESRISLPDVSPLAGATLLLMQLARLSPAFLSYPKIVLFEPLCVDLRPSTLSRLVTIAAFETADPDVVSKIQSAALVILEVHIAQLNNLGSSNFAFDENEKSNLLKKLRALVHSGNYSLQPKAAKVIVSGFSWLYPKVVDQVDFLTELLHSLVSDMEGQLNEHEQNMLWLLLQKIRPSDANAIIDLPTKETYHSFFSTMLNASTYCSKRSLQELANGEAEKQYTLETKSTSCTILVSRCHGYYLQKCLKSKEKNKTHQDLFDVVKTILKSLEDIILQANDFARSVHALNKSNKNHLDQLSSILKNSLVFHCLSPIMLSMHFFIDYPSEQFYAIRLLKEIRSLIRTLNTFRISLCVVADERSGFEIPSRSSTGFIVCQPFLWLQKLHRSLFSIHARVSKSSVLWNHDRSKSEQKMLIWLLSPMLWGGLEGSHPAWPALTPSVLQLLTDADLSYLLVANTMDSSLSVFFK
eukprot:TRINITY_DN735_c0_g1_i1.p1 TRINITY_DN735_c0_g1~~TRINITY_DN735_c0_g1_i1.p1  ORF type:complete len:484 (-),score=42.80 TRINITY_DN735_c0_g1_i1:636-2087(-)